VRTTGLADDPVQGDDIDAIIVLMSDIDYRHRRCSCSAARPGGGRASSGGRLVHADG